MSSDKRRRSVRAAIALIETRPGQWHWSLPVAKSTLARMAEAASAPRAERRRWATALRRTISDRSFQADPLYTQLSRVAAEFEDAS